MRIRDMIFQSARPAVHPSAPNPPSVPFATFNKEPASTVVVPISTDVVTAYIPTAGGRGGVGYRRSSEPHRHLHGTTRTRVYLCGQ